MKTYGHPRFYELIEEIKQLHSDKNSDYATMMDKWDRIIKLCNKDEPAVKDESIIDTLKDNAVYSLLCIILLEEEK